MEENTKSILFLILISIFIVLLIVVIVILLKNKDLITSDAIDYGMNMHNFSSCSCMDQTGKFINFKN